MRENTWKKTERGYEQEKQLRQKQIKEEWKVVKIKKERKKKGKW